MSFDEYQEACALSPCQKSKTNEMMILPTQGTEPQGTLFN